VRFAFVATEKAHYPVALLCRVLQVSRSGYYAWSQRSPARRTVEDQKLGLEVAAIFQENRGRYGSPRVHRELRARGQRLGRKRVARLMRTAQLRARQPRRFRATTSSRHGMAIKGNLLARQFTVPAPNTSWATDITYLWTLEGWLYLAVILDLFSRRVVGWALEERLERTMALLTQHGIVSSMSRKDNCWDNAVAESFFASLKMELVYQTRWRTRAEACSAVFEYIELFYNRQRRHSALGYPSPAEFERRYESAAA
jgi:putative transposase